MKRMFRFVFIGIMFFACLNIKVNALEIRKQDILINGNLFQILEGGSTVDPSAGTGECEELGALNTWLKNAFKFVQYAGIALAVVLTAVDFIQVIGGAKDDDLKKAFGRTTKRLIALILLLLTTVIVTFIIDIVNPVIDDAKIPNCISK